MVACDALSVPGKNPWPLEVGVEEILDGLDQCDGDVCLLFDQLVGDEESWKLVQSEQQEQQQQQHGSPAPQSPRTGSASGSGGGAEASAKAQAAALLARKPTPKTASQAGGASGGNSGGAPRG